jgi:glutathione S-transferase
MTANITLYAYNFRSRAERIVWTLNELELDYTLIRLDPFKGETLTPEFLQLNPQCKVPVLVHGENIFTESLAIMEYLNDMAGGSLKPHNLIEHYQFRHWLSFMMSEIEAYLWINDQATRLKGLYHWPADSEKEALRLVNKHIQYVCNAIKEQTFLLGDQFTLLDIYAYQLLAWAHLNNITLPDSVLRYLRTLEKRKAFPSSMLNDGII